MQHEVMSVSEGHGQPLFMRCLGQTLKATTGGFACLSQFTTHFVYFILLLTIFQSRSLVSRQPMDSIHVRYKIILTINL